MREDTNSRTFYSYYQKFRLCSTRVKLFTNILKKNLLNFFFPWRQVWSLNSKTLSKLKTFLFLHKTSKYILFNSHKIQFFQNFTFASLGHLHESALSILFTSLFWFLRFIHFFKYGWKITENWRFIRKNELVIREKKYFPFP